MTPATSHRFETLHLEHREGVDWLTLNRPDRFNAVSRPMIDELLRYFRRSVERGGIVAMSGKLLPCSFHSICVHGDSAYAVTTAAAVREGLLAAGHRLRALLEMFR